MDLREGIIVKTINYKENSKIIYLITENGLESLEIKGANKLSGHSKIYSNLLTNINFSSSKHFFQGGKVLNNYVNIRSDVDRLCYSLSILDLSYNLIEHVNDFKIFYKFLRDTLEIINENDNYKFFYYVFFIKCLYLLGVQPVLNRCVKCSKKDNLNVFVLKDGGMKCKSCLSINDRFIDDKKLLDCIYKMYFLKLEVLIFNVFDFDEISLKNFINEYYLEFLSYDSKANKIIDRIKSL